MYLIYVNDICDCLVRCDILMFADDSVLLFSDKSPVNTSKTIEQDLSTVSKYFASLGLIMLNAKKTKIMNFSKTISKQGDSNSFPDISIDGVNLEVVSTFKYLGINFDNKLRFSHHLKFCKNRCYRVTNLVIFFSFDARRLS